MDLPKDHPVWFGIATGVARDSHIPFLHPEDHDETRRVWSTCLRTGCGGEVSSRVRNAEGGYGWFLSRVEQLRASDETLLYWFDGNLDIEERKQAVFYLAKGKCWTFNPAALFEYWSPEHLRIYDLDPTARQQASRST